MGCVWRAEHLSLGTPVAIKLVHPAVAKRPGMLRRFLREAQAAARLRSVNVVQILDHGVDDGVPYIAMECLEGESLAQRLGRERSLSPAATAMIMAGVCRALSGAHRAGIVHRDLKPDNIFIARDEAGLVVKVLDFGIAKIVEPSTVDPLVDTEVQGANATDTGTMLGTPRYMSPEQARGHKTLDGRSDLWSLAVIAFQCLTGRVPFDAEVMGDLVMQICSDPVPVPSSIAKVPPGFDAWFGRATQRDPASRFPTVRELADVLAEILTPGQRWIEALSESNPAIAHEPPVERPADALVNQTDASLTTRTGSAPPPRAWRPLVIGAAALLAIVAAAIGISTLMAPKKVDSSVVASLTSASPASTGALEATAAPSATAAPTLPMRRVRVVVLPSDASVEVDGAATPSPDGVIEIAGALGSVHRVRVFKDKHEIEGDVSITEAGAMPPKLDLLGPKTAATGAAPPRAEARPRKTGAQKAADTAAPRAPEPAVDKPTPREGFE